MAAVTSEPTQRPRGATDNRLTQRRSTETKASFKTTELIAYVVVLVGIFVAGFATSSSVSPNGVNHPDVFNAHQVWLYATILTVGYMISRGLAKSGSHEHYDDQH